MTVKKLKYACGVLYAVSFFFVPKFLYAKEDDETEQVEQVAQGNFTLPGSQQPGPLVSFGENILDKGQMQLELGNTVLAGRNNFFTEVDLDYIYGITDNFSILLEIPYALRNQDGLAHSHGFQDMTIQLEYAVFNYNTRYTVNSVTVVGNMTAPIGSSTVDPPLGQGSPSFFIGSTYNHTGVNWIFFLSPGISYTTDWLQHSLSGYEIFYQLGIGRNITSSKNWIFSWLLEFDGSYASEVRSKGSKGRNTGGTVIYATPSLALAFKSVVFQIGAGYPIVQILNGNQRKQFLSVDSGIQFTF